MQLHQMNLGYDPVQDRLLLRMSTTEQVEYRMWFTRHMVKGLWPGLVQLMQSTPMARQQSAPEAKQAIVEFHREQALQQTKFGAPYEVEQLKPAVPGEPILIAGVRMRPNPAGGHDLEFVPREGPGVHVRLQDAMLHAFAKLLQDALKATDWDIQLVLPATVPETPPAGGERKLN